MLKKEVQRGLNLIPVVWFLLTYPKMGCSIEHRTLLNKIEWGFQFWSCLLRLNTCLLKLYTHWDTDLYVCACVCVHTRTCQDPCSSVALLALLHAENQGSNPPIPHCCSYWIIKKEEYMCILYWCVPTFELMLFSLVLFFVAHMVLIIKNENLKVFLLLCTLLELNLW